LGPFPVHIMTARNDLAYQPAERTSKPLAIAMQSKVLNTARMFYTWARMEYQARYRPVTLAWITSLKPSRRAVRDSAKIHKVEAWSLEDVLKVASLTDDAFQIGRLDGKELVDLAKDGRHGRLDLSLLRAQASICFLYLSGMRITAFLSLPVTCVNLAERKIEQDPAQGVLTKFRKAAITSLLPIPELLQVITRWDSLVRVDCPGGRWCSSVNRWGTTLIDDGMLQPSKMRAKRNGLIDGMKKVCKLAGVPYKSPHKLRHGHAIYGVKNAKTFAEFKAVSQNLMHENTAITDGIYGNLTGIDSREILAGITTGPVLNVPTVTQGGQSLEELLKNPAVLALLEAVRVASQPKA
jgi:integrase